LISCSQTPSCAIATCRTSPRAAERSSAPSFINLATFAFAQLRTVVFERVNLAESSFMQSVLHEVEFIDCKLDGVDFRGVRLNGCAIRGSSLDGVLGVDSLRGLTMPWEDVVGSAAAMALALGIETEAD
jgi:uncharacterized protein YjbI with pentapeptide repeats